MKTNGICSDLSDTIYANLRHLTLKNEKNENEIKKVDDTFIWAVVLFGAIILAAIAAVLKLFGLF